MYMYMYAVKHNECIVHVKHTVTLLKSTASLYSTKEEEEDR